MKKILLAAIIFISALSIGYAQCTQATVSITQPSTSTYTICQGTPQILSGTVTVTSTSQNGGFSYSWIKAGATDAVLQTGTLTIPIGTATAVPTYTGITGTLADAGTYILRVEDGNTGNSACYAEASVVVNINPTTTPGVIAASQTICTGGNPAAFTVAADAAGGTGVYAYVWESDFVVSGIYVPISGATSATYDEGILTNSGTTSKVINYRRRVTSGTCPQVTSNVISITVNPAVVPGVIAADQTICSGGDPLAFTQTTGASGGSGTFTYRWESGSTSLSGPFSYIAGATNATFDAPSGLTATTYYRRKDGSGTCAEVTTNTITVTVSPTATSSVTISTPNTTICAGMPVTFTATPTNGGIPTYQWYKGFPGSGTAMGLASTNATYTTTNVSNNDSYYVVMTSNLICTSPATATSNAIVITVTSVVTPSVTIYASPQVVCSGNPVTFTATPGNGGAAPLYEWSINNVSQGAANTTSAFTTSILSSTDVVGVILTSNAPCTVAPGTASASTSVTVHTGIGAGTIGSDQTICYNAVPAPITELTAPSNIIIGTPTYTWEESLNGTVWSPIPGASGSTYTFPIPLTQDIYIRRIITDAGTPYPCNVATSNAIHITVRPQLIEGVIGSDEGICQGSIPTAIAEIAAPTGGTGVYTYQWQSDATTLGTFIDIAGAWNSSYAPGVLNQTIHFRRVETSGSCGSVTSNVVTKAVAIPSPVMININDPGTICAGSAITFTATTPATGTLSYQWFLNATPVGSNSSTYTYNAVASDNGKIVSVVVTTSGSLCNAGPAPSNPVTLDIVGAITPTVSITANNNPSCAGLNVTFTAISAGGGPMPVYLWYVIPSGSPTGSIGTAIGASGMTYSSATLSDGDRVYVELTSSVGCTLGTNPYRSNIIIMIVKPIPAPVINDGDQTICAPNGFTFTATAGTGTTIQWLKNGISISGATNNSYTATETNSYTVREDNGTCSATSAAAVLTVDPCGAFSSAITGPNPITPGQQNAVYSVVNQTNFTYSWSITGGTIVSGQNTNSVTVDWDGPSAFARTTTVAYSISVTETNPSNQTHTTNLDINTITTGISKSLAQAGIVLFPNPATDAFYIEMPESGVAVSYEILDVTGLSVANGSFTSSGAEQKIDANFGAGIYQVILTYNNVVTCARLNKVQ